MPLDGKCQNVQTSFFTLFIFAEVRPVFAIHRDEQTHTYMRNLADLPKIQYQYQISTDTRLTLNCQCCTSAIRYRVRYIKPGYRRKCQRY